MSVIVFFLLDPPPFFVEVARVLAIFFRSLYHYHVTSKFCMAEVVVRGISRGRLYRYHVASTCTFGKSDGSSISEWRSGRWPRYL